VAGESLRELSQEGFLERGMSGTNECRFPCEVTIGRRNRLVYLTHAYEMTFGPGETIRIDFGAGGFVVCDSLLHAPHPGPRVAWAHLEQLGDHFGMGSGLARRAAGGAGRERSPDPPGEFVEAPSPTIQAFPSQEEACIWLRMMRLLERTGTPLEVRLDRGETSLIMSPLDE